ncbi:CRISPR-associated helicase/endonuclease Cas3 [Methylobacter tundripaludum]|uniref:CRISPR-associated helicase Cas3 n=1 Tax=Methylobacter tundripaludum (strain ATCC BAA-1195 / DSM 17260 / SV96) TaxID=697282 RepID=G3IX78_METTV|nr:CRISPR-associated helicase/endonuclease Cas3 [Methylobacter tundripaludum]EGW22015.1 CRISPR-associated helicase Cas3 [Methylobacter tundripaludum SV96]
MTEKLYYTFWGKAHEPLKAAYCSGHDKEKILANFKEQLAKQLKKSKSELNTADLDKFAEKEKWQYKQDNYAPYHLLPYHCLDVAAVADQWWQHSSALRQQFKQSMQVNENSAYAWLMFFIALHDLGKLDIRFQMKSPTTMQQLQADIYAALKSTVDTKYDHGSNGYGWFENELPDYGFDCLNENEAMDWMQQVAGHHGRIPENSSLVEPAFISDAIKQQDKQARIEWVQNLKQIFLEPVGLELSDIPETLPSMLAGFCSVCDWIGSSTDYFSYQTSEQADLKAYFNSRLPFAEKALKAFGVLSKVKGKGGMAALFPQYEPQGLQTVVDIFPLAQGLTLIEAPTGSGKTEAALAYASKLLTSDPSLGSSIIFALPTQATANAMLKRLKDVADKLFEGGANVVLAHGKRDLNHDFKNILANSRLTAQGAEEAGVQCSEWLGASKKRAFLGQIGVCTIDQVLLSVLPVRHQFVRGFGIQKSILIIDEVHAYDSYMYGLLTEVLKRQKQAAGSVILLSATLPHHQKAKLLQSWGVQSEQKNPAYPLVTHASANLVLPFELPDSEQTAERMVNVETWQAEQLVLSPEQLEKIVQAAEQGAKVAVICNLVADAQNIVQQLAGLTTIPVDLFHSRFRFVDRQKIEQDITGYYGKHEQDRASGGRILVATQVVEQSLDLDFDWMLTQLCPVDLLFQRLGRLHRHQRDNRPQRFEQPRCVVIVPTTEAVYGDTLYVYQNLRALWRTEQFLKNKEIIFKSNQEDLKKYTAYRDWIEKVYCEEAWGDEPEVIEKAYQKYSDEVVDVQRMIANMIIKRKVEEIKSDESDKAGSLTRDGEMSITVILVVKKQGKLFTLDDVDLDSLEKWQYWETISLNSISVTQRWQDQLPKADARGLRFLPMVFEKEQWVSQLEKVTFIYCKEVGLTITKA